MESALAQQPEAQAADWPPMDGAKTPNEFFNPAPQQPAAVDEAMVERMVEAFLASTGQQHSVTQLQRDLTTKCMKAALAAMGGQGEGRYPCPRGCDCRGRDCPDCANFTAPQQPEARVGGADFRDILYGAKVKLWLNPEDDESSVPLVVDATSGPTDNLEIMLHAEQDGEVVKLYTTPPAKVPEVQKVIDGMLRLAPTCESDWESQLREWAAMLAAAPAPKEAP